jgi:drug/metabolite transporter (DMT)-like permease
VFALITLLTRVVRIRNVLGDGALEGPARWGWLTLSGVMIGLAVAVLWGSASAISDSSNDKNYRIWALCGYALAAITVGVWIQQLISIISEWRSVGFVAVHVVLAVVSIGLASWAVLELYRSQSSRTSR